ncbi:MAG TPA: 3-deoxy-D-manno-octulosonic acid transferase [Pyrinomonadaceae bacterium]|nr:3-deoxy-D-manno-octulosonic acid transferase [Pyrinomonadaceae bacterium]
MYFIYSLLLTLGFIILLPWFVLEALRSGKYVTGLRQRLGNLPAFNANGKPVVWLHCVSVGEAQAAQSLVREISKRFPKLALVISTTTATGQQVAGELFRDQAAAIFYFPIDWAWTIRRVLSRLQPAAILVMETELWPRMFREARKREIPVALLNGRISDKSFGRYKLVRPFIRRVLNDLTLAAMQTSQDGARIEQLGMPSNRISIAGNLKFDSASTTSDFDLGSEIRNRFAFHDYRPLIVAASTHDPEERVVIDAFRSVRQTHSGARLLIAPRHPERFAEVAALLSNSGFSAVRRSATPSADDAGADVVLLDSIGELRAVYPLADVAFVGGSIAPHGGHSLIEPGAHGVCTVTGPHTQNFAAVTQALLDEDALIQLSESDEPAAALARVFTELLSDEPKRRSIAARAKAVCDRNRGATERTIDLISPLLAVTPAESGEGLPFSPLHAATAK